MNMQRRTTSAGFSLVELMTVVAVIAVLNALAIPAFRRLRVEYTATCLASDFRTYSDAMTMHAAQAGSWADDQTPGMLPVGLDGYLKVWDFESPALIGGTWDWDGPGAYRVNEGQYSAALLMHDVAGVDPRVLARIDDILDDGNLATGLLTHHDANTLRLELERGNGSATQVVPEPEPEPEPEMNKQKEKENDKKKKKDKKNKGKRKGKNKRKKGKG